MHCTQEELRLFLLLLKAWLIVSDEPLTIVLRCLGFKYILVFLVQVVVKLATACRV